MTSPIVMQLLNGLEIECADGAVIKCRPITLAAGRQIIDLWKQRTPPRLRELNARLRALADDDPARAEILTELGPIAITAADARLRIIELFADAYPDLASHISGGDVEALIPDFFFATTGAKVKETTPPSTGMLPGEPTSPAGASSPTP